MIKSAKHNPMNVQCTLNGEAQTFTTNPATRLLDLLRKNAACQAVKEGCGEGECGACAVFVDGKLVNSCLVPAARADGAVIETPEGVRGTEIGRAIIAGFLQEGAVQCGFCFPGMLMAGSALLRVNVKPTEADVREAISGNLCRCTGYDMIIRGILVAAELVRDGKVPEIASEMATQEVMPAHRRSASEEGA